MNVFGTEIRNVFGTGIRCPGTPSAPSPAVGVCSFGRQRRATELWVEGPSSILTGSSQHTEGDKSIAAVKCLAVARTDIAAMCKA